MQFRQRTEPVGPGHLGQDVAGHPLGIQRRLDLGQQHHELIAAETAHRVAGAHRAPDPLRHRLEQLVAGIMAVAIVDLLEMVQVHEHQRQRLMLAAGKPQGLLQPVLQQQPVRQPGQRIMVGTMRQRARQIMRGGHVLQGQHHAIEALAVRGRHRQHDLAHHPPGGVAAHQPAGGRLGPGALGQAERDRIGRRRLVVGDAAARQPARPVAAAGLLQRPAGHRDRGRIEAAQPPPRIDADHRIADAFQHRRGALVLGGELLGQTLAGDILQHRQRPQEASLRIALAGGRQQHVDRPAVAGQHAVLDIAALAGAQELRQHLLDGTPARIGIQEIGRRPADDIALVVAQPLQPEPADRQHPAVRPDGVHHRRGALVQLTVALALRLEREPTLARRPDRRRQQQLRQQHHHQRQVQQHLLPARGRRRLGHQAGGHHRAEDQRDPEHQQLQAQEIQQHRADHQRQRDVDKRVDQMQQRQHRHAGPGKHQHQGVGIASASVRALGGRARPRLRQRRQQQRQQHQRADHAAERLVQPDHRHRHGRQCGRGEHQQRQRQAGRQQRRQQHRHQPDLRQHRRTAADLLALRHALQHPGAGRGGHQVTRHPGQHQVRPPAQQAGRQGAAHQAGQHRHPCRRTAAQQQHHAEGVGEPDRDLAAGLALEQQRQRHQQQRTEQRQRRRAPEGGVQTVAQGILQTGAGRLALQLRAQGIGRVHAEAAGRLRRRQPIQPARPTASSSSTAPSSSVHSRSPERAGAWVCTDQRASSA